MAVCWGGRILKAFTAKANFCTSPSFAQAAKTNRPPRPRRSTVRMNDSRGRPTRSFLAGLGRMPRGRPGVVAVLHDLQGREPRLLQQDSKVLRGVALEALAVE